MAGFDLSNYVEVADRLREFYEKHPGGRVITSIVELTENRVVVKAEVYRETAHVVPSGAGHSALAIPGITPYTKGAELENAETSAIGRALVAAGPFPLAVSSRKVFIWIFTQRRQASLSWSGLSLPSVVIFSSTAKASDLSSRRSYTNARARANGSTVERRATG